MSQRITIEIKDKIATCLTESPIVCGNADYVVDFAFDEEWEKYEVKTAIFVVNGKSIEQVFAGTTCPVPVIQNTLLTWVGVFAGTVNDGTLSTSTPALVKCIPCITDGDKVPLPPPDDIYNQIIELINSGMIRGPQGEPGEKGDKGDAGSIKFIPVVELPTENVETDAIYLVPIEGSGGENKFTEYAYIDGKWEILGAITVNVDHSEYVKRTEKSQFVKEGITTNTETLTDEEKTSARTWIGAVGNTDAVDNVNEQYGLVKLKNNGQGGLKVGSNGFLNVQPPSISLMRSRDSVRPLVSANIGEIMRLGVTGLKDTWNGKQMVASYGNQIPLTDEEKTSACDWLGAATKEELGNINTALEAILGV